MIKFDTVYPFEVKLKISTKYFYWDTGLLNAGANFVDYYYFFFKTNILFIL